MLNIKLLTLCLHLQLLFAVCTAVIATVALAFLLLPMCQVLYMAFYDIWFDEM